MAFSRRWLYSVVVAGAASGAFCLFGSSQVHAVDHPDLFEVTSPDFADNGMLGESFASRGTSLRGPWSCGGENISPALVWSHPPADTRSFAVVMDDPDAAMGRGGNHWLMYDIPATLNGVARGDADRPGKFVGGDSGRDKLAYHGACAEPGAKAHHFIFMVYALDLPPGTLKPGLTRAEFMQQIRGHSLAEASIVARYRRAPDGRAMMSAK
jgi:Raf kinase inhibitor-like YbhB/YbcL family protein